MSEQDLTRQLEELFRETGERTTRRTSRRTAPIPSGRFGTPGTCT